MNYGVGALYVNKYNGIYNLQTAIQVNLKFAKAVHLQFICIFLNDVYCLL